MGIIAKALGFTREPQLWWYRSFCRRASFIAFRESFAVASDSRKVFASAN